LTREDITKATRHFLETLDEEGLLRKSPEIDHTFHQNYLDQGKILSSAIHKILDAIKTKTLVLTDEEKSILFGHYGLSRITEAIENAKKTLMALLNSEIKFDEKTTYGQLLDRLCQKVGFSKQAKNNYFDLFFVDFRNTMSHGNYRLAGDSFSFTKSNGEFVEYPIGELSELLNDFNAVLLGIRDFILNKLEKAKSKK